MYHIYTLHSYIYTYRACSSDSNTELTTTQTILTEVTTTLKYNEIKEDIINSY